MIRLELNLRIVSHWASESPIDERFFMNWHIIELENGSVALVRENEQEPVLTIDFSAEARERLSSHHLDVAAAMIGAGMDAVDFIDVDGLQEASESGFDDRDEHSVIH